MAAIFLELNVFKEMPTYLLAPKLGPPTLMISRSRFVMVVCLAFRSSSRRRL